jgi:HEAT repeat protein
MTLSVAAAIAALGGSHPSEVADAEAFLLAHPSSSQDALIAELSGGRAAASAAVLLGRLRSQAAVPELAAALERGGEGLRWHSALALGAVPGAAALSALLSAATSAVPDVRRCVAWALAGRPEPAAADALAVLAGDPDADVRDAAARALGG